MRAAVYRTSGSSDVLTIEDVATPEPGPGEVRVRLAVAGVNPTDWKLRMNTAPAGEFQIPGQDAAGEIDAVGPGVPSTRVGERVWVWFAAARGRQWGTAAQYTVLPSRQAVALPDGVSYDVGAGLGIPAMTAWHCLLGDGPIRDRTVLIAGGAGAVGNAAIGIARSAGAHVLATASTPDKAALATAAGAHLVVDYRAEDAAEQLRAGAPDGVHRVVEVALGANLALDIAVLAPRGVVSTYADDVLPDLPVRALMVGNTTLAFVLVYNIADSDLDSAADGVAKALAAGALVALPSTRFGLDEVAAAHDAVRAGVLGKVLIDMP